MNKLKLRKGSWILFLVSVFAWFATPAKIVQAESYEVTEAKDFYFYWTESVQLEFRTYAQQYGIDSMLWLYNEDTDELLASNDDYFGLDSYISYQIQPNTIYRIRAGVCCGNPDAWRGNYYILEVNNSFLPPVEETTTTLEETTTTVEETTTTIQETTTTLEPTTTTEETTTTTSTSSITSSTTTTTVPISTTTELISTVPIIQTTTTTMLSTTTSLIPTTSVESTTTTIGTTTTIKDNNLDNKEIINIISNDMSSLSTDEIKNIFQSIDVSSLSPVEEQELIKNLNNQNDDVKKLFESEIDVFGNGLDEYVPSGSLVDVGTRRVIIAATAAISTIGVSTGAPGSSNRAKR